VTQLVATKRFNVRTLELAFLLITIPFLVWPLISVQPSPPWLRSLPLLAVLFVAIHLSHEGYRWHMLPGYLLVASLLVFEGWRMLRPARLPVWASLAGMLLLATAIALGTLLPVFEFPPLTGPYPVGTAVYHFVDASRAETFSSNPADRRELMVQLWYPAEPMPGAKRAFYRSRATTRLKKENLALVRTYALAGAPLARAPSPFPVLIFSPSWNGGRGQNTFQTEELASHGFVVAGIDHPYGTDLTIFPDGRVVKTALPEFLNTSSDGALQACIRTMDEQVRIRAHDAIFVLDQLRALNSHDPSGRLEGRLDLTRAGIFGHSFGGAVAMEACWLDRRFRACLNMDGLLCAEAADAGVKQPFLIMNDDTPPPTSAELTSENPRQRRYAALINRDIGRINQTLDRYGGYEITIRGAHHMNYSDSPLYTPIKRLSGAGPVDVYRAMHIINAYTLAFFDCYLNGTHQRLLDGSLDFPEVTFDAHQCPSR
jgi:predicted dienelactone hydrolase